MRRFIPTPSVSFLNVGPFTIHYYAICIIVGIVIAIAVAKLRSPKNSDLISDISIYAIPSGIIGARAYHVITTPNLYFNKNFWSAFKIWEGGLGIWGAIAGGFVAAAVTLKRRGQSEQIWDIADALAPGLLFAQAVGRVGNWFNGELFGRPTRLPWGLEIPIANRPEKYQTYSTFHPTFLYEAIWCLAVGVFLIKIGKRKSGQIFWLYVALYSFGRFFIEMLRSDYAFTIIGVRINILISFISVLLAAWQYLKLEQSKIG
jgi:prolipoprotein diacylglyceryl transferase